MSGKMYEDAPDLEAVERKGDHGETYAHYLRILREAFTAGFL